MGKRRIGLAGWWVAAAIIGGASAGSAADEQPFNVRFYAQVEAACNTVQVVRHYAYIGDGPFLRILDVATPTSPVTVGRLRLPGPFVEKIRVSGRFAYIADGTAGLQIVDIANPRSPVRRGGYDTTGTAESVFVSGGLAYVADGTSGVQIVDVSNPSSPTLRGSLGTGYAAHDVFVSGNLAYVAAQYLLIFDVTNPAKPVFRSYYYSLLYYNVFISGGVAYLTATHTQPRGDLYNVLDAIDVTNPDAPKFRGRYGRDASNWAGGFCISNGFAYAILGGLCIVDIRNPSSPTLRGFYPYTGLLYPRKGDVFVSGDLVYVAEVFDLQILRFTGLTAEASRHWPLYP